ncbi:MAG: response regulator [Solirubrobacteraceae bacterium]
MSWSLGRRRASEQDPFSSRYSELSHDLACTAGFDGVLRQLNPAWTRTLGWTTAELRSRPFVEFVHPDDRARTERETAGLAQAGLTVDFVNRYATKDGGWRWLEWRAMAVGREGTIYASARDITGHKEAEAALAALAASGRRTESRIHRSEKLLANLLESAPDAVVIADAEGRITLVNEQTKRLFGYERAELVGASLDTVLRAGREPDAVQIGPYLAELGAHPVGGVLNLLGRRKDGSEFPVEVSLSAIESDDGQLITASVRDITDRRRTEDDLAVAFERSLEVSRLKSEFLANMSHEIRTPLNGVIGMGGLLLDTDLNAEQREYAEALGVSADALMSLITNILDFSKIEAGKLELDPYRFDLRDLVDDAASILAARAHEKGLELIVSLDPDLPNGVYGDAGRVRQVLTNLLTNAIKFTVTGEVVVEVTRQGGSSAIDVRFAISDTGVGIASNALEHIFDSFSQADNSTTRRYGGTGLGLAICEQLVELMGGRIGVDSAPGAGSTFWFTIPLMAMAEPEPPDRLPLGTRVLVVDDNETNRMALKKKLSGMGFVCETDGDAGDGLRRLLSAADHGHAYALAIIDIDMPEVDGVELATQVRATPSLEFTRLLMLTSSGSGRAGADRVGVDGFAAKPVRESRLAAEIVRILDGGGPARAGDAPSQPAPVLRSRSTAPVLVAEDNPVNQLVARRMLEKRGFRVEIAVDGREAVAMHAQGHYQLIFMDCQMPELDGYAATAEIRRAEGESEHTRVVAMTANTLTGDRERCLESGMDDYLAKPLRPRELEEALTRALAAAAPAVGAAATARQEPPERRPPLLDATQLLDTFAADHEGRARLVALFLDQARETIGMLAGATDPPAAGRLAHSLKGSAAAVGASRLSAVADRLGQALAGGTDPAATQAELEETFALTCVAFTEPSVGPPAATSRAVQPISGT